MKPLDTWCTGSSPWLGAWLEMAMEGLVHAEAAQGLESHGEPKACVRACRVAAAIAPVHDEAASKALRHLISRELSRGWRAWYAVWEVLVQSASQCARAWVTCSIATCHEAGLRGET